MAEHNLTRRELLATGVMSGMGFGGVTDQGSALAQDRDASERREINQTLKALVSELQGPEHSMLPGDMGYVGRLREQMVEFIRATNKWPDFFDVGYAIWFAIYDWHIRFGLVPNVVRLADNRYGLSYMFSTLVLRPEQTPSYISVPYDKDR